MTFSLVCVGFQDMFERSVYHQWASLRYQVELIQKVQDPVQAAPTDPADPAEPWDPTEPQKEKSPVAGEKSLSRPRLVGYLGSIRAPYSSEGGSAEEKKGWEEGQEEVAELFIAAQQFHTQCDAPMPLPREDAKVSSVDWRIKDVLLVDVVIAVSRKNLKGKKNLIKWSAQMFLQSFSLLRKTEPANHSISDQVVQIFSWPWHHEKVKDPQTTLILKLWCWTNQNSNPGCHVTWLFWPTWGWNCFQVWNYWVKDLFCWLFCWTESANLVHPGGLVLHDGPGLSIVTVSHFKSWDKLDGPKVFGALRDDPWNLLWRLQIHLKNQKPESRPEQQTDHNRS